VLIGTLEKDLGIQDSLLYREIGYYFGVCSYIIFYLACCSIWQEIQRV